MSPDTRGDAVLEPTTFAALPGWKAADHRAAWRGFRSSAMALLDHRPDLRPARTPDPALRDIARHWIVTPEPADAKNTRDMFERWFRPARVTLPNERAGFLTGYYEPVVPGSPVRTEAFAAPILPRPDDLVAVADDEDHTGLPSGATVARRDVYGRVMPYPDRTAIELAAMASSTTPIVWLRDWVEVFMIHVQGSARVVLPDGETIRLVYAGRNGRPYTSIGRWLVEHGEIAPDAMSLEVLKAWLRRNGQGIGDAGRNLMARNQSYIFFRDEPARDAVGPTGGAGLPLVAGMSVAIDRTLWPYGLPFWITSDRPMPGFGPDPLARLFVAQDTGSAILGPARADLYVGSGDEAGRQAGSIRHSASFTVLLPQP